MVTQKVVHPNSATQEAVSARVPAATRVEKPWGWELLWTHPDLPYCGKVLHIWAGHRLSLQVHEAKTESWLVVLGRAQVVWEDGDGNLEERELLPGRGYTCEQGRKHRLVGITDCDVVEVSTPESGTTWRLEDDYGRPDETESDRNVERQLT
jgi:mannose-6-phosphate isomerase-like protein (cupin superfamily)